MIPDATCARCGQPMISCGYPEHPACEQTEGRLWRVDWPATRRDAALAAVADAHPGSLADALAIITAAAHEHPKLSANSVRLDMRAAHVPGPVVGAAFRQAAKDGVLTRAGYVASTDVGTHAHPVGEWTSKLYRGAA